MASLKGRFLLGGSLKEVGLGPFGGVIFGNLQKQEIRKEWGFP